MPDSNRSLRVAVIEDDQLTRQGLVTLIDGTPGFQCVGAFRTADEAIGFAASTKTSPSVVLLDIHLPGTPGIEAIPKLKAHWPHTLILMLTVFAEDEKIFASLCCGASGYLLKRTPPARLLEAIREASDGGAPISPEIARRVIGMFREFKPRDPLDADLGVNEIRLLQLLADGYSYQAAGGQLHVSVNTVRSYIRVIYEKLHVHSKSEAVSKALRAGII